MGRPGQRSHCCAPAAYQERVQDIVRSPAASEGRAGQKLLQPLRGTCAGRKAQMPPVQTMRHPWHQTACNMSVCQVMAEQGDPVQAPWSGCIYLWQGHAIVRTLHTCSSSIWGCIAVMQQKERFYLRPDDYQRCPSGMAYAAPKG